MSRKAPGPGQGSLFDVGPGDDAAELEAPTTTEAVELAAEIADDGVVVPFRRPSARGADEPEELEDLDLTVDSGLVAQPSAAAAPVSRPASEAAPGPIARPRRAASGPADHALAALAPWRAAGVLGPADVHLAAALARLAALGAGPDGTLDDDETAVVLASALAARAPRLGHVCLDLATVHLSVPAEVEGDADTEAAAALDALPWPVDVDAWRDAVAASPLVTVLEPGAELSTAGPEGRPLVLDGTLLYLERYRVHEDRVAAELLRRATSAPPPAVGLTTTRPTTDHDALFDVLGSSAQQRAAAEAGAAGLLSVIVGGPGTGKTTTVAALLALLLADAPTAHIALVAPTGKAAARMGESITALAAGLASSGVAGAERLAARLAEAEISTVHRRLGYRPDGTFRHDARNPLVHDVVIVDETSMVSLPLMARLLDAVRPDARLVLVGDPGQLASVEAGSVLGDIAGPAVDAASAGAPAPVGPLAGCVSVLTESYRFPGASPVGRLADAVRIGDADTALAVLAETAEAVGPRADEGGASAADGPDGAATVEGVALRWARSGADTAAGAEAIAASALGGARRTMAAADAGDAEGALDALGRVRVLCAHRRGPFGVAWWNQQFEDWLAGDGVRLLGSYVGRPVLVTANDAIKDLYNGDLGVVVRHEGTASVAFPGGDGPRFVAPARVDAAETVHAMTIHKSQGSEFDEVVVVLPPAESRLATRELLYTAVTRARHVVTLVGGEDTLRRAIANRVVRQTGLRTRLWGTA